MHSKKHPGNSWNSYSETDKAYLVAQFLKESTDDLSRTQWQTFLKRHRWAKKGRRVDVIASDDNQANDMLSLWKNEQGNGAVPRLSPVMLGCFFVYPFSSFPRLVFQRREKLTVTAGVF